MTVLRLASFLTLFFFASTLPRLAAEPCEDGGCLEADEVVSLSVSMLQRKGDGGIKSIGAATSGCTAVSADVCADGKTHFQVGEFCTPKCQEPQKPLGAYVCVRDDMRLLGPGCEVPLEVGASDVDAVADAADTEDMVFKGFRLVNPDDCLIWPGLPPTVQQFILLQATKFGPSAKAIQSLTKLGTKQQTEFFLSIEQVSILVAQLLCGATMVAQGDDLPQGGDMHPQPFAFGRAMEHWHSTSNGSARLPTWRRTTLVAYGTFDSDAPVPNGTSTVRTGTNLTITSGCDSGGVADSALGDSKTLTVVFAGPWVGGYLTPWYISNAHGAQEEKIGTLSPEMMLATETLRKMGAGLLSNGREKPWLPEAGWYIIGAGSYVKGKGYPRWGSEKIEIQDTDYFSVGTGRRIRRRGLVSIMAKPCNDRGSCGSNSNDVQYRCFNRQVADGDLETYPKANMWGIAAGGFDFSNWPAKTQQLLRTEKAAETWLLQGGGWGAGAYGCGTLYGGLLQTLAAKKGGWQRLRMCWAGRGDAYPSLASKLGYAAGDVTNAKLGSTSAALMIGSDIGSFADGKLIFPDYSYGSVAAQLQTPIHQKLPLRSCEQVNCDRWNNKNGNCFGNMNWCYWNAPCGWHQNETEDIRDFVANGCNPDCASAAGFCTLNDVSRLTPRPTPNPTPMPTEQEGNETVDGVEDKNEE